MPAGNGSLLALWDEFPTIHPLIVHFPVVLLPLGTLLLMLGWALRQKALEWTAAACMGTGWLAGALASWVFHPHPEAMTLLAQDVLHTHETWAWWVLGLSGPAALFSALQAWRGAVRFRMPLAVIAFVLALGAAFAVLAAGHEGATLTHIHRVGGE